MRAIGPQDRDQPRSRNAVRSVDNDLIRCPPKITSGVSFEPPPRWNQFFCGPDLIRFSVGLSPPYCLSSPSSSFSFFSRNFVIRNLHARKWWKIIPRRYRKCFLVYYSDNGTVILFFRPLLAKNRWEKSTDIMQSVTDVRLIVSIIPLKYRYKLESPQVLAHISHKNFSWIYEFRLGPRIPQFDQ